jgi:hypothetical protein
MTRVAAVRNLTVAFAVLALVTPVSAGEDEDALSRSIVVVSPSASDARLAAVVEAVSFWNQTLSDMGLPVRLRDPEVIADAPTTTRALEINAKQISQGGRRLVPGRVGPVPPPTLID